MSADFHRALSHMRNIFLYICAKVSKVRGLYILNKIIFKVIGELGVSTGVAKRDKITNTYRWLVAGVKLGTSN